MWTTTSTSLPSENKIKNKNNFKKIKNSFSGSDDTGSINGRSIQTLLREQKLLEVIVWNSGYNVVTYSHSERIAKAFFNNMEINGVTFVR